MKMKFLLPLVLVFTAGTSVSSPELASYRSYRSVVQDDSLCTVELIGRTILLPSPRQIEKTLEEKCGSMIENRRKFLFIIHRKAWAMDAFLFVEDEELLEDISMPGNENYETQSLRFYSITDEVSWEIIEQASAPLFSSAFSPCYRYKSGFESESEDFRVCFFDGKEIRKAYLFGWMLSGHEAERINTNSDREHESVYVDYTDTMEAQLSEKVFIFFNSMLVALGTIAEGEAFPLYLEFLQRNAVHMFPEHFPEERKRFDEEINSYYGKTRREMIERGIYLRRPIPGGGNARGSGP